ncbi:MAG: hypothetical protein DRJ43_02910 [Thermoprotei archaeon]|nr:MAG: hypothetical protein DRJ43_02910 [Thermoprotei archaeon]
MQLPRLELAPQLEAVGLGLYVKPRSTLVLADLHIGYEQALEGVGIYLPAVQYSIMKRFILRALEEVGAERLVLLGDVKHEFGSALRQEWSETLDLLSTLKEREVEVHVVRGNHDNFLIPILRRFDVPLHDPYMKLGEVLLTHGHKQLPVEAWSEDVRYVVMAHEHPAVVLRDELGIRIKLKCFLKGVLERAELIVLPALSPLMPGTEVNALNARFLSPVLRQLNVDSFSVYAVDLESGIYDFGPLSLLKQLLFEV